MTFPVRLASTTFDIKTAEQKLNVLYGSKWRETVQNAQKLRTLKLFKSNFNTEEYVLVNMTKYERSITLQFKCGILPLGLQKLNQKTFVHQSYC